MGNEPKKWGTRSIKIGVYQFFDPKLPKM